MAFQRSRKCFLKNWPIFKTGPYRHAYQLNLELCGATTSKNFTNKRKIDRIY